MGDKPWRPRRVGGLEHFVARAGIVIPSAVRLQVHRRELPDLSPVIDTRFKPPRLFFWTHLEPVFDECDARLHHRLLDSGNGLQEPARLFLGATAPNPL